MNDVFDSSTDCACVCVLVCALASVRETLQAALYSGCVTFMPTYELLLCRSATFSIYLLCLSPPLYQSTLFPFSLSYSFTVLVYFSSLLCFKFWFPDSFIFVVRIPPPPFCRQGSSQTGPAHHHSPVLHRAGSRLTKTKHAFLHRKQKSPWPHWPLRWWERRWSTSPSHSCLWESPSWSRSRRSRSQASSLSWTRWPTRSGCA